MKSESIIEVLTTATEALRTMTPLLKLPDAEKGAEFQRLAPVVAALRHETRRVCGGLWSPAAHRVMHPWQPERVKPDTRSPALLALSAEVDALDAEYKEAVTLWERCVAEEITNPSQASYLVSGGNVVTTEIRDPNEAQRKIETATALRDAAGDKVQAARSHYYAMLRAEQAERRQQAHDAQQAEQAAEKARAAEVRKKSFAKDALKFFGIRA